MKSLEVKIAYLNKNCKIVERNKEFYTYFETVGFLYANIEEIVAPEEQNSFLEFVKTSTNPTDFRAFQFKKITGEYICNVVSLGTGTLNGKKYRTVQIFDISQAFAFFNEANALEKKVNCAFSILNEYLFFYEKSTNIIRVHNFMQGKRITLYEQDIDSWKTQFVADGLIEKSDITEFEDKINELKACNEDFSMTIASSLRFSHSMFEKLIFHAVRMEEESGIFMIGRILPEIFLEQTEKSNDLLQELKIDALTGVYNKKTIMNFAQNRFVEGAKENTMLAIVDLDHFKPVNDAYGHLAGDKVLAKAGEVLRNIVGESGVIGRYGGDEFLLILEDMTDESMFRGLFRTINNDIRSAFADMFTDIKVTASIGAAMYPKDGKSFDELFKKADFCLYRAKDKGRDRYVFFREDLHGELYKKASAAKTEGIKYDVREVLELKSMADFLLNLGTDPKPAVTIVLEHMLKTYNLGAINIYYGEAMQRMFCVGKESEKLADACYVFSDGFAQALGGKAYIRVDFTTELKENAKPFGKILDERGVKSSIQCILGTIEHPLGLITFDRLKEGALWAEYEMNCCVMFAAAINLLPESKIRALFV